MTLLEMLNSAVLVPQWYLAVIGLAGVIISMCLMVAAVHIMDRRRSKTPRVMRTVADDVDRPPTPKLKKVKQGIPPVVINITPEGYKDLDRRAIRRSAYQVSDVAVLLDVTVGDIMRWINRGELVSFVTSGERWVTPAEIKKLLGNQGVLEPVFSAEAPTKTATVPTKIKRPATPPTSKSFRQHFWYTVKGVEGRFATLREACKVAGQPLAERASPDWKKVPVAVRDLITREPV